MKQTRLLFSVLALLVCVGCATQASKAVTSHIYAFGDSYSDNGNLYKIIPDEFETEYWQGRSSNGPVAVEVFAAQLGVELTDYAVGRAMSDYSSVDSRPSLENTGMLGQIKKHKTDLNGKSADPQALYFIMVGAGDYLGISLSTNYNSTLANQIVDNIALGVSELAEAGAKRFLVVGPVNFAILPAVIYGIGQPDGAIDFQDQMDTILRNRIKELTVQMNLEITYFDYVALSNEILKKPSNYGLTNITDTCFNAVFICAEPDQYYLWDEYHPTRRVHEIFGKAMAAIYGK
jgi:cholinesterase